MKHLSLLGLCALLALHSSVALGASSGQTGSPRILVPADYAPLAFAGLTLRQAQDDAVMLSPDVEIARARVDSASAALTAARTGLGPALVGGYVLNPQAGASPPSSAIAQRAYTIGLQTTLSTFSQFLPLLYQADAAVHVAQATEATAERDERIRAATLYYSALRSRAALAARAEALALATAQQQAAQRRFKAGDAPHIDVVRAEVAVAQAVANDESARAIDANADEALLLETGAAKSAIGATASAAPPDVAQIASPEAAVQRALEVRAEIASAKANVSSATSGLSSARAGLLPAITVSAGYEHGVDSGQPIAGGTANVSFELPLNRNSSSQVSAASAAVTQARAQLRAAQRSLAIEVGSAIRNLNAAIVATAATTRARVAAQEELNATTIGYRSGASSSLERTAASVTYADARLAELSAIYDEALARAITQLELGP